MELLSSPLQRSGVGRFFVIGGPVGLAIAIVLSLWVSYWHVRHTAVVQVDTQWVPEADVAIRAQIVAERPAPIRSAAGTAMVRQGTNRIELGRLGAVGTSGIVQATLHVPALEHGPAELTVRLTADNVEPIEETLELEIAPKREPRQGAHTVSGSTLQYGDDTDPQPAGARICVRPLGRILAGFSNTLLVRVLQRDGKPLRAPVELWLVDGEFMGHKAGDDAPQRLVAAQPDGVGLLSASGLLESEVVRLEVRVLKADGGVLHKRRVRLVSFAGAVAIETTQRVVGLDEPIGVFAQGLSARRPVFVDVHAPDGAHVAALEPFAGEQEPRPWQHAGLPTGLVQFEAYHFTNAPGEATAVARVQRWDGDPADPAGLKPLIAAQRASLGVPRVERGFDPALERKYLDWLESRTASGMTPADVASARASLIGTLPLRVYGPNTALATRQRDLDALAKRQHTWTLALRLYLLGGGGLFLAAMTFTMIRAHTGAAAATLAELSRLTEGEARIEAAQHVGQARRAALFRGLGVIAVMAAGLVLTTIMLESLIWVF